MKTVSIRWRKTGELRYDRVYRAFQCTFCETLFKDDFVYTMDENCVTHVPNMSYCPICGAEFTKRGE